MCIVNRKTGRSETLDSIMIEDDVVYYIADAKNLGFEFVNFEKLTDFRKKYKLLIA